MTNMISEVYAAPKSDIQNLEKSVMSVRIDLQKDISGVKADIAVLKWMMGLVMAGVGAQLVKSFLG